ncbi:MAG: hypothetical protein ACR2OZ_01340 [Verrucomicrobiales bacterium]
MVKLIALGAVAAGVVWWLQRPPGAEPSAEPIAIQPSATAPAKAAAEKSSPPKGPNIPLPEELLMPPVAKSAPTVPATEEVAPPEISETAAPTISASSEIVQPTGRYPQLLVLDEVAAAHSDNVKARADALNEAFSFADWVGYRACLARSLAAHSKKMGQWRADDDVTRLVKNPYFDEALRRYALLARLRNAAQTLWPKSPTHRDFVQWLLDTPDAAESFLLVTLSREKLVPTLRTWAELWSEDKEAAGRYRELALACALVYPEPRSFSWNKEKIKVSAMERYAWYKRHASEGDLEGKIHQLSARDLVWVVNARVPESELEWALKKVRLKQKSWGEAYGMVEYDMEKAVKGGSKYDSYTFAEILKKGGICGDRTYFAANTARANGIPAAELSGDGKRGPHAWVAWLADDNEWQTSGRFGDYGLGHASHPLTRRSVSEQEFFWRSAGRKVDPDKMARTIRLLWLAELFLDQDEMDRVLQSYDYAVKASPAWPEVWRSRIEFWLEHRLDAPVEQWRDLVDAMKKEFREDGELMRLARRAEEEVIFKQSDAKLVMKGLKKDTRKLAGEESVIDVKDLALTFKRQADVHKANNDLEGVRSVYRKAMGDTTNPAFFKVLARNYFDCVRAEVQLAQRACRDMESAFNRHLDEGGDYFDIQSQNSALEIIIDCYKTAGETKKADSLQRDLDRRSNKSVRKAL